MCPKLCSACLNPAGRLLAEVEGSATAGVMERVSLEGFSHVRVAIRDVKVSVRPPHTAWLSLRCACC